MPEATSEVLERSVGVTAVLRLAILNLLEVRSGHAKSGGAFQQPLEENPPGASLRHSLCFFWSELG